MAGFGDVGNTGFWCFLLQYGDMMLGGRQQETGGAGDNVAQIVAHPSSMCGVVFSLLIKSSGHRTTAIVNKEVG